MTPISRINAIEIPGATANYSLQIGTPEYNRIRYPAPTKDREGQSHKPEWKHEIQKQLRAKALGTWRSYRGVHPIATVIKGELFQCIKHGLSFKTKTLEYVPFEGNIYVQGAYIGKYDKKVGGLSSFTLKHNDSALVRLRLRDFGIHISKKNNKLYWKVNADSDTIQLLESTVLKDPDLKTLFSSIQVFRKGYDSERSGGMGFLILELKKDLVYHCGQKIDDFLVTCDSDIFFKFKNYMRQEHRSVSTDSKWADFALAKTSMKEAALKQAMPLRREIIKQFAKNCIKALHNDIPFLVRLMGSEFNDLVYEFKHFIEGPNAEQKLYKHPAYINAKNSDVVLFLNTHSDGLLTPGVGPVAIIYSVERNGVSVYDKNMELYFWPLSELGIEPLYDSKDKSIPLLVNDVPDLCDILYYSRIHTLGKIEFCSIPHNEETDGFYQFLGGAVRSARSTYITADVTGRRKKAAFTFLSFISRYKLKIAIGK